MAKQFDKFGVDRQLCFLIGRAAEIQRALDFAAPQGCARLLPERLFLRPQIFRKLELHIEVAVLTARTSHVSVPSGVSSDSRAKPVILCNIRSESPDDAQQ